MKVLRLALLFVIAGCGAHGSGMPPTMQNGQGAAAQMRSIVDVSPTAAPKPAGYVANATGNSVTKYAETENGNEGPVSTLTGVATKLSTPAGVALDATGKIYAANGNNTITAYQAGAANNTAPLKTISCGGLNHPSSLTVDSSGNVYVTNRSGNSVSIFASSATGCVSGNHVLAGSKTGLNAPSSIAVQSGKIYVTNANANSVTEYPASAFGNMAPSTTIAGANTKLHAPAGIAFDAPGNIYVANTTAVTVYTATASGNAVPFHTISGSLTLLTGALGVGVSISGRIFVTDKSNALNVYVTNANGNVAPSQHLAGALTRLSIPQGLNLLEPLQVVGVRLTGESSTNDPTYGAVLGYFDGLTSLVSQIVHLTAGDPVVFHNVDSVRPHTLSFLNDATPTSAHFPAMFNGSSTASIAGTSIGAVHFSTGAMNPGSQSSVYYAAPGLFTVGCAFHYDSNGMRTVIVSK